MPNDPSHKMTELADRLMRWSVLSNVGAKDVLVWYTGQGRRVAVAIYGDALKLKLNVLSRTISNRNYHLDHSLQRALGIGGQEHPYAGRTAPLLRMFPSDDAYRNDFIDGIERGCKEFLGSDDVYVTLIPAPGEPWSEHSDPTVYYSARRGRPKVSPRPKWLVEVQYENKSGKVVKAVGADFCAILPRISSCRAGAVVGIGSSGRGGTVNFLVTHTLRISEYGKAESAGAVAECGGLLVPSLAVGIVPATSFGELVLVADLGLILPAISRAHRGRGAWPIVIYKTDTWTVTTSQLLARGARELFLELTGTDGLDWISKSDFWVLGAPLETEAVELVRKPSTLLAAIGRKAKIYDRDLSYEQLRQVRERHFKTFEAYPYLEAKSNGIVARECFPLAVCPAALKREAARWLDRAGFRCQLLVLDVPTRPKDFGPVDGRDADWDYAWAVRDALVEFAYHNDAKLVI